MGYIDTSDFSVTDGLLASDINTIQDNSYLLHSGNCYENGITSLPDVFVSVAAADIDFINNVFAYNSTNLRHIRFTNGTLTRPIGNIIYIVAQQTVLVENNSGTLPDANYAYIRGGANYTIYQYEAMGFIFDGTYWNMIR